MCQRPRVAFGSLAAIAMTTVGCKSRRPSRNVYVGGQAGDRLDDQNFVTARALREARQSRDIRPMGALLRARRVRELVRLLRETWEIASSGGDATHHAAAGMLRLVGADAG